MSFCALIPFKSHTISFGVIISLENIHSSTSSFIKGIKNILLLCVHVLMLLKYVWRLSVTLVLPSLPSSPLDRARLPSGAFPSAYIIRPGL